MDEKIPAELIKPLYFDLCRSIGIAAVAIDELIKRWDEIKKWDEIQQIMKENPNG